jgi:hypothetical protein
MNITEIFKTNPELAGNLTINVNASDLKAFAEMCIEAGKQMMPKPKDPEEYITSQEIAKALNISLVTLWQWDKNGITSPLRVGNRKLYRRSDLEKILNNG